DPCRRAVGTVVRTRVEPDGDLHFDVRLDPGFQKLLSSGNEAKQGGALVVEFMPRDGGHLPAPTVGDRVALVGAWVDDTDHGWNELHPVWSARINGGATHTSGPRYGGSPAGDRSYNADADCRTPSGARCVGSGS